MKQFTAVHYLNQYFGGIGGEDKADMPTIIKEGSIGPGNLIEKIWQGNGKILATIICGDNYFSTNPGAVTKDVVCQIAHLKPDVLVAGPAFASGRYGISCGYLCREVAKKLGIPCVTAMEPENPGVQEARGCAYIVPTTDRVAGMGEVLPKMARLAQSLSLGEVVGSARQEGYLARGYRKNILHEKSGAERAVNMILAKLKDKEFVSEIPLPLYDQITPALPLETDSKIKLALVTEAGLVPNGNPDHLEYARATKWLKYALPDDASLLAGRYYSTHGGFNTAFINSDPLRVLPMDAANELVKGGIIEELYKDFYVTTGMNAPLVRATKFGEEMARDMMQAGINMAIITAT